MSDDVTVGNFGHGHVYPRPDGVKMRCGGPGLCPSCSRDFTRKNFRVGSLTAEEVRDKLEARFDDKK